MAVTALERKRAERARERAGIILLMMPTCEASLVSKLLDKKLLKPTQVDDRDAVQAAALRLWQNNLEPTS